MPVISKLHPNEKEETPLKKVSLPCPSKENKTDHSFRESKIENHHRRIQSLPTHPSRFGSLSDICEGYSSCEELDDLISGFKIRRQSLGENHPKVALSLNKIGNVHSRRGDYMAAAEAYSEALRAYRKAFGDEHVFVATTLGNIGTLYWRMGKLDDATAFLEESLRIHRTVVGEIDDNAEVANALYSLGIVRFLKGDYEGAMTVLNRALQGRKNLFGNVNVDVSRTIDAMGSVRLLREETDQAMECYQEALRIKRALLGNYHPSVATTTMNVAKVHRARGEIDEAISVYKDALKVQRAAMFVDWIDHDIGLTLHTIGDTHMMKGENAEAMEAFLEATKAYRKAGLNDDDKRVVALKESTSKARNVISDNS